MRVAGEPRPAGGSAEARVRETCRARLAAAGFSVAEQAFEYSAFPGRWATPLGGVVACLTVLSAAMLGRDGHPGAALTVIVAAVLVLGIGGRVIARRVTTLPWARAASMNLVATRGMPRVWLVAHLDSKSQPVAMLARVAGIVIAGATLVTLAALVLAAMGGEIVPPRAWRVLATIGVAASLPVIASVVGAKSPGALDNGSGLVTVLLAADALPRDMPLGVLLTSAEELGMAGARAFAANRPPAMAINVDGVDDHGSTICMYHGRAARVRVGVARAARAIGMRVCEQPTIPGLLTDGVALGEAGWSAVTLSRGGVGTLWRIHRAADTADRLSGVGMHELARLAASAAREIA
ncbi:MAG TPA: M28 family peptidase [Gemmatimonadaceae bacterium]|nr:M28 family peptidase [Gemmatimonadaceae bacterium]